MENKQINTEGILRIFLNEDLPENIKSTKGRINDLLSLLEYVITTTSFKNEVEEAQYLSISYSFLEVKERYFEVLIKYGKDVKRLASSLGEILEKLQVLLREVKQSCKEDIYQDRSIVAVKLHDKIIQNRFLITDIALLDEINYAEEVFTSAMQSKSEVDFITYIVLAEGIIEKLENKQLNQEGFSMFSDEQLEGKLRK